VVLLNYWATWCLAAAPRFPTSSAQTKYSGKLQIIGLSDDTGPVDEVKNFPPSTDEITQ